jgi:CubicO group peptidase (beta-lactamase class C family)
MAPVILLAAICVWWFFGRDAIRIGAAYAAKTVCSSVFNSGEERDWVLAHRVAYKVGPLRHVLDVAIDTTGGTVDARALGAHARAIHRTGVGCTLLAGVPEALVRDQPLPPGTRPTTPADHPWPTGSSAPAESPDMTMDGADLVRLRSVIDEAFREPDLAGGRRQTLAVVVIHRGRLIAERYAPTHGPHTPMLGWSMGKSVMSALTGVLVEDDQLSLDAPAPVPEWTAPNDGRQAITLDHLLHMTSGLDFQERYAPPGDAARMLLLEPDAAAFAAASPLASPPGEHWNYSSGTTNIIAQIIRDTVGGTLASQHAFVRDRLFTPAGMHTAFFEADASGTLVGSSFVYASPRDWARFGLMLLQDGVLDERRILPAGWVAYASSPTGAIPAGNYGAHLWLNAGDPGDPSTRPWRSLTTDAYAARGHEGQFVMVVPSRELVVVRLGISRPFELNGIEALVAGVSDALPF